MHFLKKISFAWGSVMYSSACFWNVSIFVSEELRKDVMNFLLPIGVPNNLTPLVCSAFWVSLAGRRWSIFWSLSERKISGEKSFVDSVLKLNQFSPLELLS